MAVEVVGQPPILLDLGTGSRYFGLARSRSGERFHGHCLVSHYHWDHIQGLPFFPPLLRDGSVLELHGPTPDHGDSIASVLDSILQPPLFPVGVTDLPGDVRYHEHGDESFTVGDIVITTRLIPHIGRTLGFRLDGDGWSVAYLSDHQQPGIGVFEASPGALELCAGADLVIHDAQYTAEEFAGKSDWGHCTIDYAVWLAGEAGARSVALYHHDPMHDDEMLDAVGRRYAGCSSGPDVIVAREGLRICLGTPG